MSEKDKEKKRYTIPAILVLVCLAAILIGLFVKKGCPIPIPVPADEEGPKVEAKQPEPAKPPVQPMATGKLDLAKPDLGLPTHNF
ncbi:hypothetical protein [Nannocystis pusilla]|uniref:hypothetical protein n=1 Tax=Nannocystis pusilla TaxID=889268 RepID=UPI003DA33A24